MILKKIMSGPRSENGVTFLGTLSQLERGLKAKSMGLSKVRAIVLDLIGVDSILFDQAVSEIFYFKDDVGASLIKIFVGNPDVSIQWPRLAQRGQY